MWADKPSPLQLRIVWTSTLEHSTFIEKQSSVRNAFLWLWLNINWPEFSWLLLHQVNFIFRVPHQVLDPDIASLSQFWLFHDDMAWYASWRTQFQDNYFSIEIGDQSDFVNSYIKVLHDWSKASPNLSPISRSQKEISSGDSFVFCSTTTSCWKVYHAPVW